MPRTGIRFDPPHSPVPEAVDWLFLRAFCAAPERWNGSSPLELGCLDTIVGAVDLLPRVWSRTDREWLAAELDEGDVRTVEDAFLSAVALEMRDNEASKRLAAVAAELRIPVIFLKGTALQLGGYVPSGVRAAADIDVLVPRREATCFSRALLRQGCRLLDLPASDQHQAPLEHPLGSIVEIHHRLRGVSLARRPHATAEDLLAHDLCEQVEKWPPGSFIPRAEILVAHLLVHALSQHGFFPRVYRQVQVLADLQDLGFAGENGARYLDRIDAWIGTEVSSEELAALRELLQRLENGERVSELVPAAAGHAILARHLLAGASEETYRQALKIEGWAHIAGRRARSLSAARTLRKALFLSRGQIDIIYGRPTSSLGYLGWRLWRPFDLVIRAVRSAGAWRQVRSRGE